MTYKQIDASREIRLWVTQIVLPAVATVGAVLYTNPELRHKAADKVQDIKYRIKTKFKK